MTSSRAYNGRSHWTPMRDAALIEHYSSGTITNAAFAKQLGTSKEAIEARAHVLKLTRQIRPSTRSVVPHIKAGTYHPKPWVTIHRLGA